VKHFGMRFAAVIQQVGTLVQEARFLCVRGSPRAQKKQLPQ
jgi:hypothetical protein